MAQGGLTGLQNALKDSTGRLAPVLLDGTKRRGGPVLSILSDHPEAQLIFARPINDHVHRTPRLGQWVLISGTWYQPLDRRLLGRSLSLRRAVVPVALLVRRSAHPGPACSRYPLLTHDLARVLT